MRLAPALLPLLLLAGGAAQAQDTMPATMTYACERGVQVPATYVPGTPGVVVLHVEGRQITLLAEVEGELYGWPSDGSNYAWRVQGPDAALLWRDGATGSETVLLAACTTAPG